jgi:hypothetical protein
MHGTSNTAAISNKRADEFWLIATIHNITLMSQISLLLPLPTTQMHQPA